MDKAINKLNIIKGPTGKRTIDFKDKVISIGRGSENSIVIEDKTISREHVKITIKDEIILIRDLGSHNGTWIGSNRIKPGEEIELKEGASFTIGNTLLSIETPHSKNVIDLDRHIKSDTWLVIDDRKHIKDIINNLIANKELINLRIKNDDTVYTSRFLRIEDDQSLFSTLKWEPNLIIEKLVPEKGNRLIQTVSEVNVEFQFKDHLWKCVLKFHGISSLTSDLGFIMRLPEYMEIEDNRNEARSIYEIMGFVAAEFSMKKGPEKDKIYNLDVVDCSKNGLGLLITKKDMELAKSLKKDYRIKDITFYSEEAMIKVMVL
jgi:hypothetical protein